MRSKRRAVLRTGIGVGLAVGSYMMIAASPWTLSEPQEPEEVPVVSQSSVSNLQANYDRWSTSYGASEPAGPGVTLIWTRGLSSKFSEAKGIARFDLEKGTVSVQIEGLEDPNISDVWVVDNQPGFGRTVAPEKGDRMLKVGTLQFEGDKAWLDGQIADLSDLQVDMVVVAKRDGTPGRDGVLYGTTSLFQKIYHYPEQTPAPWREASGARSWLMRAANATAGITPDGFFDEFGDDRLDSDLINKGRNVFFNDNFGGNGRTCGTCHKEDDNMALSLRTIAKLPKKDPLFIVELKKRPDGTSNLKEDGGLFKEFRMEKPALMRKQGLILENLNGFVDLDDEGNPIIDSDGVPQFTEKVNMRAPQHVLSMRTTLSPPPHIAFDDGTGTAEKPATEDLQGTPSDEFVFEERTGWGGDGTPSGCFLPDDPDDLPAEDMRGCRDDFREPGDFVDDAGDFRELRGSLRFFIIGAIVQHYPRTLNRTAPADFKFPNEQELNQLEAFMLSMGLVDEAQRDDLNTIRLRDELADRGRLNYMGFNVFDPVPNDRFPALNCNSCHFNGGGNTNPKFPFQDGITPNHGPKELADNGGSIRSHNRSFGPRVEELIDQAPDVIVQAVNVEDDGQLLFNSIQGDCSAEFQASYGDDVAFPNAPFGMEAASGALAENLPENDGNTACNTNPFDNGFGRVFGDEGDPRVAANRFNAPPVFEAMDNSPFFHGHQISTPEGAVAFYATTRHFRDGSMAGAIVPLNGAQVINVARFIRAMGADFNAGSAITLLEKALLLKRKRDRQTNAQLALAEIDDAIELLEAVDLHFDKGDAVPLLKNARKDLKKALPSSNKRKLEQVITELVDARDAIVDRSLAQPSPEA